ncbi:CatA-like O-acetyltransferase [Persicobacter psychrovividus]|uniref:Chloramphenicol acetyltransferase n=1 Tax=Persicobacter psychrovividus TaxID=387638 RepID=A0ABM7VKY7_9BACT|nr:hypothetical protein PEPS_39620 [Persicobacter psychrovividus]
MSQTLQEISLSEVIELFDGKKINPDELSSYENWAMDFFHKEENVREPYLQMTLQLDISAAYDVYQRLYKQLPDATFTAYLMWNLSQTCNNHPAFLYRKIGNDWYQFKKLPIFCPIAVGGNARFTEILLENSQEQSLAAFFVHYKQSLQAVADRKQFIPIAPLVWSVALFIGNLPNLQFTGFTLHTPTKKSGRPYFYFGKRYESEGKKWIPMLLTFDHSNLDPFVISPFIAEFEARIASDQYL